MITVEKVKQLAYDQLEKNFGIIDSEKICELSPKEALWNLDWQVPVNQGQVNQTQLLELNSQLDPSFCFGRTAIAGAFIEKYFPESQFLCGEVTQDLLARFMQEELRTLPITDALLQETLNYEDPHTVIVVNGEQFDPIFVQIGWSPEEFRGHVKVELSEFWPAMTAIHMVEQAKALVDSEQEIALLLQARAVCNLVYVSEALVIAYLITGQNDLCRKELAIVNEFRPTARSLFVASEVYGDQRCKNKFFAKYPKELYLFLQEEVKNYD